jgi:putative MATE family efflux protein
MVVKNARLIEGPIEKTLIRLTIPMILGTLGLVIFNLADTYFVGQLGTNQLAALSFTFPVVMVIGSIAMGLGIGASAVISRSIGEGNHDKVKRLTTDSLTLSLIFVGFFALFGLFTVNPLFRILGASGEILTLINQYMTIWYLGVIFVVIPMVGNNAIRATGDTKTPGLIMVFAAFVNIVLDPILIFGIGPFPRLEIAGAAIATVIARASTLVLSLYVLTHREKMITIKIPQFREIVESWKQILYIGLPTAATRIVIPLGAGVILSIVATFGSEAVAGFGVATRIEFFALTVVMSLASVLGPFVGQNWGAGKFDRIKSGMKFSYKFSLVWGFLIFLILVIFGSILGSFFSDDPNVISVTSLYLLIIPIGYGLYGVLVMATSALSVLKKPLHAAILTLTQTFILYIPMAYVGSYFFGLGGVFAALPISYLIAGIISKFVLNRIVLSREKSNTTTSPF